MQMISSPIQWGNATLVLDHRTFEEGYTHGRQYYFEDACEDGESDALQHRLTASHLLGLIAIRDEHGCYQLDDGRNRSAFQNRVEELFGVLVGYLSGPLHPERHEERTNREKDVMLIEEEHQG
ncbi:MAG TPA: hypothetical protein VHZ51_08660 [Ktedonobacteraceae bacterium]|jgi:hypothetical protein|nr:hypothetical protein [Ktedonobacteraceae bacterium]